MTIKPEWGWTPEVFVVFSTINGNPMFVFRIGRLPNIPYDEGCSFSEAFLRTYRKIVWDYLEQNDYKGGKFNIDLRFKHDLSNAQKECCYADTSEAVQLLQENAYRVKEYLVKICRANAETGIQSDGSVPVPFVASRKETVSSCTAEVKQPDDESTRHLRNIVKEDKQHTKQLSSIQTDIRDGFEATQKTIREVGETIGEKIAEEIRQAVKSAELTATPKPKPEETDSQNDRVSTKKEVSEETDGEWVLASDWADDHAFVDGKFIKSMSTLILDRLSNYRQSRKNTNRKHNGHDIFVDSKGREFFKDGNKDVYYREERLEKDVEILTRPKRSSSN